MNWNHQFDFGIAKYTWAHTWIGSIRRPNPMTVIPALAKAFVISAPIPDDEPDTQATFPCHLSIFKRMLSTHTQNLNPYYCFMIVSLSLSLTLAHSHSRLLASSVNFLSQSNSKQSTQQELPFLSKYLWKLNKVLVYWVEHLSHSLTLCLIGTFGQTLKSEIVNVTKFVFDAAVMFKLNVYRIYWYSDGGGSDKTNHQMMMMTMMLTVCYG